MEIVSSSWDVVGALLVWLTGLGVTLRVRKSFRIRLTRSIALYVWHTLFCLAYLVYVSREGGDAVAYYRFSQGSSLEFSFGTAAVQYITSFFSVGLNLSILGAFLGFNILGTVGLLAFDASLQSAVSDKGRWQKLLATMVVFLPSASFWSSAIGKDSVSFAATGLALYSATNFRRRIPLFAIAVLTMFVVRPHIAALMVLAVSFAISLRSQLPQLQRLGLASAAVAAAVIVVPFAIEYGGLAVGAQASDIEAYVSLRQSYNQSGGGAIDISNMSLAGRLFTYMFRPLPFEAHSLLAFAASIDNVILLGLCIGGAKGYIAGRRPGPSVNNTFLWTFSLSSWLILSTITSNLGISMRQKWMFVPMILFLLISVLAPKRTRRLTRSESRPTRSIVVDCDSAPGSG